MSKTMTYEELQDYRPAWEMPVTYTEDGEERDVIVSPNGSYFGTSDAEKQILAIAKEDSEMRLACIKLGIASPQSIMSGDQRNYVDYETAKELGKIIREKIMEKHPEIFLGHNPCHASVYHVDSTRVNIQCAGWGSGRGVFRYTSFSADFDGENISNEKWGYPSSY